MKIAYLASQQTLPNSTNRRLDAFEHDQMTSVLRRAFEIDQSTLYEVAWDDPGAKWEMFDAVLIGSTWDYCDRYLEFLEKLKGIHSVTPVFNSPEVVEWNSHKNYLRMLESQSQKIIPTHWIDDPNSEIDWFSLFDLFETDKLVMKRQVGSNSEGQSLIHKGSEIPAISHPMMIQPFLKAVAEEGEFSFVFIDGELSHTLLKKPSKDDYRIQSVYGGTEHPISPDNSDRESARSVLEALDVMPLYARVDMLKGNDGELLLMELELIEPFLYPIQGTDLGTMMHAALKKRL